MNCKPPVRVLLQFSTLGLPPLLASVCRTENQPRVSRFEEWTGWCLLVVLALYDLCAVLSPCGPLKALVHLMQACARGCTVRTNVVQLHFDQFCGPEIVGAWSCGQLLD